MKTYEEELFDDASAIYKFVYENPNVHRNTVRKKLVQHGRVSAKFFSAIFDSLISSRKLVMEKELVSVNPNFVELAIFQKSDDDAFILTPSSKKKYKISKSVGAGYKSGDLLDVIIEKDSSGKKGAIIILGRADRESEKQDFSAIQEDNNNEPKKENLVLGRVVKVSYDDLVFIPNKKSFSVRQIPILNNREEFSSFQDKICIMRLVDLSAPLLGGYIEEVKGEAGNPVHEYDAIAECYGAVMSWDDPNIQEEIENIPTKVDATEYNLIDEKTATILQRGRVVDLRHIPFTTVDPKTCKDMDDAIYSTFNENGDIVCYTAVANVTKYVSPTSEIGKRYMKAGFTIYAPNKAYNILPTKLSTGICSLNPNEDRLAFVVKTVIDGTTGKVKEGKIYDAIIKSQKKLSYEEAQEIVNKMEDSVSREDLMYKVLTDEPLSLDEQVLLNYYAGQTIKVGFEHRKMIRFVSNKEREIKFDEDLQNVVDIIPVPHLYYHEVIEAFMVTANEVTAKYARDNGLDNIYRVHESPNPNKLDRANEFFELLGVEFEGDLSAEGTRSLIDLIRGTANEEVINKFLIKMQSRAVYSDHLYPKRYMQNQPADWVGDRISHYALQSPHYSHTTSPIRRVPDYVTQFNILAHMHGTQKMPAKLVQKIVEIANERQLEVDQAEKDFDDISSVMYAEKHIGEKMSGRVSKIRYTSPEEGYEDDIVVIVKNEDKGICVEIPLSQVLGRQTYDCELSSQRCAVYDGRGNVVLSLCKPIDFIIEKADRKTMIVVGKTNRELIKSAEAKTGYHQKQQYAYTRPINPHSKEKNNRNKRIQSKKGHKHHKPYDQEFEQ